VAHRASKEEEHDVHIQIRLGGRRRARMLRADKMIWRKRKRGVQTGRK